MLRYDDSIHMVTMWKYILCHVKVNLNKINGSIFFKCPNSTCLRDEICTKIQNTFIIMQGCLQCKFKNSFTDASRICFEKKQLFSVPLSISASVTH